MRKKKLQHEDAFGWLVAHPDQMLFKVKEAAEVLGVSGNSVKSLLEVGELWGICHDSIRGSGQRRRQIVTRDSILCYLAKTADHDSQMKTDRLCEALDTIRDLNAIRTIYTHLAERLSAIN